MDQCVKDNGPEISGTLPDSDPDEVIQTMIDSDDPGMLQIDRIHQAINIEWPQPQEIIDEFKFDGLASMAFPSLFPFGLGDPTRKERIIEVSETDGFKHLLKYATRHSVTNELYFPFAKHPRFKFWAYDRSRRRRGLNQCSVYLDQNIGKKKFKNYRFKIKSN